MKIKDKIISVDIDFDYDIEEQIREVIRERCGRNIDDIVVKTTSKEVCGLVKNKIAPYVDNALENGRFEYAYDGRSCDSDSTLDGIVKVMVEKYLSDPHYVFDENAKHISQKYKKAESGKSLIQLIVISEIRKIINEEYKPFIEECVKKYLIDKEVIAKQMGNSISEFFRKQVESMKLY